MEDYLPLFLGLIIFSFSITSILIVPFIDFLYKLKLQRRKEAPKKGKIPLFDKLHDVKAGTPIGGGILLILVIFSLFLLVFPFLSYMGVYVKSAYNLRWETFLILFTLLSFGLVGLIDDLVKIFGKGKAGIRPFGLSYGLTRSQKFAFQWFFALLVSFFLYFKIGISIIHIPLFDITLNLGVFYIFVAAFLIVLFSNAYNITDGLDGLATGLLLICLLTFLIIASHNLDTVLGIFVSLWIGSLIAFLYFNVYPARVFMGDVGALSFGAMLALIGLLTGQIMALFVIGGLFFIEALSSFLQMFSLKFFKRRIFTIAPIHHLFLALGWAESKVVARAWIAGVLLAIFGLWLATI